MAINSTTPSPRPTPSLSVPDGPSQPRPPVPIGTGLGRGEPRKTPSPVPLPMADGQGWICDLCTFTYTSPRPLAHPPNHRCAPPGRIPRIRKMILGEETR